MQVTALNSLLPAPTRAQVLWACAVQGLVIALAALALFWAPVPPLPTQVLLAVLAVVSLLLSLRVSWRRSEVTATLTSLILATACWLSADHTWDQTIFLNAGAYIPLITPIIVVLATLLLVWGLLARVGVLGESRLGQGALIGGALIIAYGCIFYQVANSTFKALYAIDSYQRMELLAIGLLYPLALWLGGMGIRARGRIIFLPLGFALLLLGYLLHWHIKG